jgi:glycosyltransferase involved in cell wall biosynthesis
LQLAELLGGEGASVALVQVNAPYHPTWVRGVKGIRALFRLVPYLMRLWRCARDVQLFHVMANSGWSWHLFAAPAVWIARLRGVPVVVNYRGGEAADFLERSARQVRWTLKAADALVVPSEFLQDVFGRHGIRAEIVPNIVDASRFRFVARKRADSPHLVVARNLEPIYDVPTAIRAYAIVRQAIPSARLSVAGSGPELDSLHELARAHGLEDAIRFTGRLDPNGMAALYGDADVLLNPSRVDNMPNSVLEAHASGVPVVSTRVGGVPYIIRDGVNGLLVDAGDAGAMASAVLRLLRDADMASRLAAAGAMDAQRYTWPHVRPRLAEIYERALPSSEASATTVSPGP